MIPLDILKVQQLLKPQVFRGMNNEYMPERIGDTCVIPKLPQALVEGAAVSAENPPFDFPAGDDRLERAEELGQLWHGQLIHQSVSEKDSKKSGEDPV